MGKVSGFFLRFCVMNIYRCIPSGWRNVKRFVYSSRPQIKSKDDKRKHLETFDIFLLDFYACLKGLQDSY